MAYLTLPSGTTSFIIDFPAYDSSSTTGALKASLTFSSFTAFYSIWAVTGAAVSISLQTMTKGTWATGGLIAVDGTNMTGMYQLGIPNLALASTPGVTVFLSASGVVPITIMIQLSPGVNVSQALGTAITCTTGGIPDVNMKNIANAAVATGTAQIGVNAVNWAGGAIVAPNVTGVPKVDNSYVLGTVMPASATAGIQDVNVKNMNNVAATSITTVSAYQGTTQPLNFTGTGGSALVQGDTKDWNGTAVHAPGTAGIPDVNLINIANAAVSATTAQLGVNAVQINAVPTTSVTTIPANIGTTQPLNFTGTGASALAKVDVTDIATAAVATGTAQLGVNLVNIAGSAVATGTAQLGVNVVSQANIDFGALQKTSLNAATPTVTAGTITAGAINNAAFNADVASTAYGSNTLAQMLYKFFDNAFTGYADGSTFTSNGLLDRLTKLMWIMRNQINVTDSTGAGTILKDDNATTALSVSLTDNAVTTTRTRAA